MAVLVTPNIFTSNLMFAAFDVICMVIFSAHHDIWLDCIFNFNYLNSNLVKEITLVVYGIANGNQSTNVASTSSCTYTFTKKGKTIVQLTNNFNGPYLQL